MFVATIKDNDGVILTDMETGKTISVVYAKVKNKKRLYIKCDKSINIKIFTETKENSDKICENVEN